jgi:hypothetical protein
LTLSPAQRAIAAAASERERLAAEEIWIEWPWWSRRRVAQVLARRPGARRFGAIYNDLPERDQVMRGKGVKPPGSRTT